MLISEAKVKKAATMEPSEIAGAGVSIGAGGATGWATGMTSGWATGVLSMAFLPEVPWASAPVQ